MNKKGITLMELLAYLALVGIVVTLLTGTFSYALQAYDRINGQGAVVSEANFIMSNLITQTNAVNPAYVKSCGENCIELVIDKERKIDPELGIIVEDNVNKIVRIRIDDLNTEDDELVGNIYIANMQLNNSSFGVDVAESSISFECYDDDFDNSCQKSVLSIKLAISKINKNGERISDHNFIFENRFTF
jgi:Tfp pilus assembly protein PilE